MPGVYQSLFTANYFQGEKMQAAAMAVLTTRKKDFVVGLLHAFVITSKVQLVMLPGEKANGSDSQAPNNRHLTS